MISILQEVMQIINLNFQNVSMLRMTIIVIKSYEDRCIWFAFICQLSMAAKMNATDCAVAETENPWATKVNLGLFATQSREKSDANYQPEFSKC